MNTKIAFEYLSGKKQFDVRKAREYALRGGEEGIVLLENKNKTLPLKSDETVAFFGRMQKHYIILGTGSGGRVHAREGHNLFDSLVENGVRFDKEVEEFYDKFVAENPYDRSNGWTHPMYQVEPLLDEGFVADAAARNEHALIVFTREAGECLDLSAERGGYYLTETELNNLKLLRKHFKRLTVLLNVVGVIDVKEINDVSPDALLMLWTGGMMGAVAAANVLTGKVNPSGRLPDTMAVSRSSYPSADCWGDADANEYREDIFVGYRYFNTFAPQDVIYPFGYGLSYTEFEHFFIDIHRKEGKTVIRAVVSNVGTVDGSEVLQCYIVAPNGNLGKPKKTLAAFQKTPILKAGESCTVSLEFSDYSISSYDDSGVSGNKYCYILEKGEYTVELGSNSVDCVEAISFTVNEDIITKSVTSALAPLTPFDRMVNKCGIMTYEPAPLKMPLDEPIPDEIKQVAKDGMTLDDVFDGKITAEELVARFSDADLIHCVRAEGMASPKVTPGTAAAFVGITPSLKSLGLPALCCTDGPSGIRITGGGQYVAYPAATCLAATFNTQLVTEMYEQCGNELASIGVDILLGPGTNIHRDPLCGRNFEYYSEDPLLAGKMAAAVCIGLDNAGVSGAVKHFMANSQENNRHASDSILSERAIREIYAKPFEICVNESNVRSVMTSYNRVNGRWAASNYDLTTRLLRNDFGFDGFVMTDWWANVSGPNGEECKTALSGMVHAQNDVYMVTPDAVGREDDLFASLENGTLKRADLQRCCVNLVKYAIDSLSYEAQRNGYGNRDLKSETEGKEPAARIEVVDGSAVYMSGYSRRMILRVEFVSETDELTQTNVMLNLSTKNAGGFIVGGTNGEIFADYREIGLSEGENKFVFTSENGQCKAIAIELYEI